MQLQLQLGLEKSIFAVTMAAGMRMVREKLRICACLKVQYQWPRIWLDNAAQIKMSYEIAIRLQQYLLLELRKISLQ